MVGVAAGVAVAASPTVHCTAENPVITADVVTARQAIVVEPGVDCVISGVTAKAVRSNGAASVSVTDSTIIRGIHIRNTIGNVTVGHATCQEDPTVGNNVMISATGGNVAVCQITSKNNIRITGTMGMASAFNNCVGNNLTLSTTVGIARARFNMYDNNFHHRFNGEERFRDNAQGDC